VYSYREQLFWEIVLLLRASEKSTS